MDSELWFSRRGPQLWAAVVEGGDIVEVHQAVVDPGHAALGAVYLSRVQRVVPTLGAAFVQLASGTEAYLEAPAAQLTGLGSGQALIVQVRREAHAGKRARVTARVELAGRTMTLRRGAAGVAISRRIEDSADRDRLARWARAAGPGRLVLRTASAGVPESVLDQERAELAARFTHITERSRAARPPVLLEAAPGLIERLILDHAGRSLRRVLVENDEDQAGAERAVATGTPIERHRGKGEEIWSAAQVALQARVRLECGGSLTIEATRALWAIDVDSGAARVSPAALNREAARQIARQIRLRDMAGTILVDFLQVRDTAERDALTSVFLQALRADRRYLRLTGWTELGLCEIARRREGPSLSERLRSAVG